MPRFRAPAVSALIGLLGLALTAHAAPAPIVFDFEDGLQGWELAGAAQRVQTQVLGGEWAIFLDGLADARASMFITVDIQEVGSVTCDQLIIDGSGSVVPVRLSSNLVNNMFIDIIVIGFLPVFPFGSVEPFPEQVVAFIDNITFHPVPESSSWLLLSLGIAGMVMVRRKLASRA